ncbi:MULTISPECIES: ligase-associated DNA damage response endonuclease PdeM [unclassified Chelatococcus]|uniref:ligase-associated DNA damage response endonuclease PdeM n=1 Tax=unclassified Chelatococcus TaxID=2638111 RepID=UPI001BCEBA0C|nr:MULTISPECIES: ligase-associated DNA damage response endonuclease PdeM [unclassified Chelatococcus]MBS7696728.1 ligase-associated DNA damage response endonuclease PdeM [Chelatococcus sp. YT9]MBX3555293.1 ligase-associated DNA damage response endonuclease PdeM [Chelatococcus sp.]
MVIARESAEGGSQNTARAVLLGGLVAEADPRGALFLSEERMLVVADLHLEKGSSYARRRIFLPPYDTKATLERLAAVIDIYAPRIVVALGDSFHDDGGGSRLDVGDRDRLEALQRGRQWIWITGNHDPSPPVGVGGDVVAEMSAGGIALRHIPGSAPDCRAAFELAGHLHPVAKVASRGQVVRRRCFALGPGRCVLPAFGAYAGGLNVRDEAFAPLFPRGMTAHVLGRRTFAIASPQLLPD